MYIHYLKLYDSIWLHLTLRYRREVMKAKRLSELCKDWGQIGSQPQHISEGIN